MDLDESVASHTRPQQTLEPVARSFQLIERVNVLRSLRVNGFKAACLKLRCKAMQFGRAQHCATALDIVGLANESRSVAGGRKTAHAGYALACIVHA